MLGDALRLIRTFHELSQAEVASQIGVSNTYISEIERNNREPSLTVIRKYAELFDIPTSSIIFFAETLGNDTSKSRANRFVSDKILRLMEFLASRKKVAHGKT